MLGEAPGVAPGLVLSTAGGPGVGGGALGGGPTRPITPVPPRLVALSLRKRSSAGAAAVPGCCGGAGVVAAGPPRLLSHSLNSRAEIFRSLSESTASNGTDPNPASFHSSGETKRSLLPSIRRNRSAEVRPILVAPPRAALQSRNSASEILPSPSPSTTVNGTGARAWPYHS